jgi:hypothetical protein
VRVSVRLCVLPSQSLVLRYTSAAHVMSAQDSKSSLPLYLLALGADRTNIAAWTDLSVAAGKAGKHKLAQWAALGNLATSPSAPAHFLAANSFMYCAPSFFQISFVAPAMVVAAAQATSPCMHLMLHRGMRRLHDAIRHFKLSGDTGDSLHNLVRLRPIV